MLSNIPSIVRYYQFSQKWLFALGLFELRYKQGQTFDVNIFLKSLVTFFSCVTNCRTKVNCPVQCLTFWIFLCTFSGVIDWLLYLPCFLHMKVNSRLMILKLGCVSESTGGHVKTNCWVLLQSGLFS